MDRQASPQADRTPSEVVHAAPNVCAGTPAPSGPAAVTGSLGSGPLLIAALPISESNGDDGRVEPPRPGQCDHACSAAMKRGSQPETIGRPLADAGIRMGTSLTSLN